LDQLPLLSSVEGQAAVLATLNPADEDGTQASLSLDEALVAVEVETVTDSQGHDSTEDSTQDSTEVIEPSATDAPSADAPESPPHD
jgi:hypothetical protein